MSNRSHFSSLGLGPAAEALPGARYVRQVRLPELGIDGQRRLRESSVLVIGAGGLGSPVLQYLAAAGVGRIGVIDDDQVEQSNLHRQVLHDADSVGHSKVESAERRIRAQVGDEVVLETHAVRLSEKNAEELFSNYDLVIDGADNFPTRYLVCDASIRVNVPVVWGSILGFDSQVSVFWADPPSELSSGGGVTLRDVFPSPPTPGTVPSCAEAGVIGALCGQAGSIMAMEALKVLGRFGRPLFGRILVLDALSGTSQTIEVRPEGREPSLQFPKRKLPDLPAVSAQIAREEDWFLVDVREQEEFASGHAAGAVFMPLSGITYLTAKEVSSKLARQSAGRKIALYCHAGVRSRQAGALLAAAGLSGVHLLTGDYPAWVQNGGAVELGVSGG